MSADPTQLSPFAASLVRATANYAIFIPVASVAVVVMLRRLWRLDLIEAAVSGALTIALVKLGAALYAHPRPFVVFHAVPLVAHAADNAFPSDHLAAIGLAAGYLWTRSRALAVLALAVALAVGWARVLALLHWPIDVACGFLFGLAAAAIGHWIVRRSRSTA